MKVLLSLYIVVIHVRSWGNAVNMSVKMKAPRIKHVWPAGQNAPAR